MLVYIQCVDYRQHTVFITLILLLLVIYHYRLIWRAGCE